MLLSPQFLPQLQGLSTLHGGGGGGVIGPPGSKCGERGSVFGGGGFVARFLWRNAPAFVPDPNDCTRVLWPLRETSSLGASLGVFDAANNVVEFVEPTAHVNTSPAQIAME
jgi:hypothetical protein